MTVVKMSNGVLLIPLILVNLVFVVYSISINGTGTATFYTPHLPSSCNGYEDDGVNMIAAASDVIWNNGAACGKMYTVRCTGGTDQGVAHPCKQKTVTVKIVDYCLPGCAGTIDLSQEAFAMIADPDAGKIKIEFNHTYKTLQPSPLPPQVARRLSTLGSKSSLDLALNASRATSKAIFDMTGNTYASPATSKSNFDSTRNTIPPQKSVPTAPPPPPRVASGPSQKSVPTAPPPPPRVASGPSQTSVPITPPTPSQIASGAPPNPSPPTSSVHRLANKRQFPQNIVIAASVLGTLILLAATIVSIICCFRWKKTKQVAAIEAFLRDHKRRPPVRYRYSTLEKITNSFQNKLGEGGFGSVFKGKLPNDGTMVAVKLLTEAKGNGDDFINEVASISLASHTNCITLLGYCVKGSKRAIVYHYMPNGSLDKYIYIANNPSKAHSHLGWPKLLNIAIGIARGLEYLHKGCNTPILHLDIKPGNILLDNEFCPVISDFGLAKLCVGRKNSVTLETARGTPGYAAPELVSKKTSRVSHKADVYSYGMMLLEIVGGRKNLIPNSTIDISEIYYPRWIYDRLILKEDLKLCGVKTVADEVVARKMIFVGLQCIQNDPLDRPSMREVLERLEGQLETLQIPPKP